MKINKIILLLAASMLILTSCGVDDTDVNDRLSVPDIDSSPIEGKWLVTERIGLSDDGEDLEEDNYIDQEGIFHKDAIILGKNYSTEPSYKIKSVKTADYLIYKYQVEPNILGIKKDKIQIVTILDDNQYFTEFIKYNNNTLFLYEDDYFYKLEKTSEEVSLDEALRYIDIEKSVAKDFQTTDREKKETGLLLGLKIPTYDEVNDLTDWEYRTLWFRSQNNEIKDIYEVENLLLPRKNGFWTIEVDRKFENETVEDQIKATPQFKLENNKDSKSDDLDTDNLYRSKLPSVLRNILYVSNDYISMENIELKKDNRKRLGIYSLDNIEGNKSISLSDIIDEDGKEVFKEGLQNVSLPEENIVSNENNIALTRENGHWIFKGRVNYEEKENEIYKDFNLRVIPTEDLVSYDEQSIPWDAVKIRVPGTIDMYSSPNEEFIIVFTELDFRVYDIDNSEILGKPAIQIALPKGTSVIMSEWATGGYIESWEKEVIKQDGKIIEEESIKGANQ